MEDFDNWEHLLESATLWESSFIENMMHIMGQTFIT